MFQKRKKKAIINNKQPQTFPAGLDKTKWDAWENKILIMCADGEVERGGTEGVRATVGGQKFAPVRRWEEKV